MMMYNNQDEDSNHGRCGRLRVFPLYMNGMFWWVGGGYMVGGGRWSAGALEDDGLYAGSRTVPPASHTDA